MTKSDFKIVFMGTPDFAVESLRVLIEDGWNIAGVVTTPDKPAGRGRKLRPSPVKKFAEKHKLTVLQPANLKDEKFNQSLQELKPDLQVVVAFRMLPQQVWDFPLKGTINLHASLLPDYRGAAPINWVIMNGEKETGITTFFIEKDIDTGKIIHRKKLAIDQQEDAGTLHDRLMKSGAKLLRKTVEDIFNNDYTAISQAELIPENKKLHLAPKIDKQTRKIDWQESLDSVYNQIRGLSPFPAAWTKFISKKEDKDLQVKIYKVAKIPEKHTFPPGYVLCDNKNYLKIAVKGGFIDVKELQLPGRKRLPANQLLLGFDMSLYILQIK